MVAARVAETLGLTALVHVGTPGKALLAFLPEDERDRWLPTLSLTSITPDTITDVEVLRAELAATRARGYAISRGERSPWAAAVAAICRQRQAMPRPLSWDIPGGQPP